MSRRCLATIPLALTLTLAVPIAAQDKPAAKPPIVADADKATPIAWSKIVLPAFPAMTPPKQLADGVHCSEIELKWPRGASKLWVYLPDPAAKPKSLPCVFIAPAGSNLLFGMDLGDGDRKEHLPWVAAGFAVVAYEIEGVMPPDDQQTDENVLKQTTRYVQCQAGLEDARAAIEYALAKVPAVDPQRLFAAGHSSAATMALMFAAHEPRLRGCAAFMPIADVDKRIPRSLKKMMEKDFAGYGNFLVRNSPLTHAERYAMPLFVFAAEDDENVPFAEAQAFVEKLQAAKRTVTFEHVPTGNHYQPMIDTGIPKAIAWAKELAKAAPAAAPAAPAPAKAPVKAPVKAPAKPPAKK